MRSEKMREEFEAAFVEEEVRFNGEGFRSSAIHMVRQNTINVRSAWWAWQASRAAIVVELPDTLGFLDGLNRDYNEGVRACKKSIEALGLKVAK